MSEVRGSLPVKPFCDWSGNPAMELMRGERADWPEDSQPVQITPADHIMATVELCRNTNSLAHSDVVISRYQPGIYLGGESSRRGITNPGEEIKVCGVVESVNSGVGPAAGGEFDWVGRPH